MDTLRLNGLWHELKGQLRLTWGRLSDDDVLALDGGSERLVGILQERYGLTTAEAERQVEALVDRLAAASASARRGDPVG